MNVMDADLMRRVANVKRRAILCELTVRRDALNRRILDAYEFAVEVGAMLESLFGPSFCSQASVAAQVNPHRRA